MAVKLNQRVRHNGVNYDKGDVIGDNDINEAQEQQLLDIGAASRVRGAQTQGGQKSDRGPSKTKQRISNSSKTDSKSVAEKAQARNAKRTAQGKAVPQTKPADVDGKVPPATDELPDETSNKQPEPNVGAEGGDSGQDDTDTTQGNDGSDSKPSEGQAFKVANDEYTAKPTKSGQVQYRKNGNMIGKVDFVAAAQEAGVKVEG